MALVELKFVEPVVRSHVIDGIDKKEIERVEKRINKISKGRVNENKVKAIMLSKGWLVDKKVRTRFSSPDFFGKFDLLCIRRDKTVYIQVKSNLSDFYKARKEIREWLKVNNLEITCRVYLYLGKHQWRIHNCDFPAERDDDILFLKV